jgi:hypothetical protein
MTFFGEATTFDEQQNIKDKVNKLNVQAFKHSGCAYQDMEVSFQECNCEWCMNILQNSKDSINISIWLAETICGRAGHDERLQSKTLSNEEFLKLAAIELPENKLMHIQSIVADYAIHHFQKIPGICPCAWWYLYH